MRRDAKRNAFLVSIAHLPGPEPRVFNFSGREGFIAGRLVVLQMVHGLAKGGEFFVHSVTGTALVAERTMLRNAVPGIKRKDARKCDLLWRIELLFVYAQDRNRDTR